MAETADVIVVGAGVIGSAIAYYLSRDGAKVVMLEQDSIGSGASAHATGSFGRLGTEFNPGPSFLAALESYRMLSDLVAPLEEETDMDLLCQRRPSLRLAIEEDEEGLIKELMEWQREFVDILWIDGDDVRKLEPRLSTDIRGAVYENESIQLDSYRFTLALARAAESYGAKTELRKVTGLEKNGSRITGVHSTGGDFLCDAVVLATGAWSDECAEWLNFPVPVRPLKGERLLLKYDGEPLQVIISSPRRGHMISRLDGLLSVGSTAGRDYDDKELYLGVEFDRRPTERARLEILQRAIDVFPGLEDAQLVQQLAGSRPLSVDGMPIVGPVPGWEGVMLAMGHGTKGIHLAPITGRVIADYILRGRTEVPVDMTSFLPERFATQNDQDFGPASDKVEE